MIQLQSKYLLKQKLDQIKELPRAIALSGRFRSKAIAKEFGIVVDYDISSFETGDDFEIFAQKLKELNIQNIIAFGGGKMSDLSKELAFRTGASLHFFATVLSNDGFNSNFVVLPFVNQGKSIERAGAKEVFLEEGFSSSMPARYMDSLFGEIFSKYSSKYDYARLPIHNAEAEILVAEALESFEKYFDSKDESTIVSAVSKLGESMNIAGYTAPCSGSEHLLAHVLSGCDNFAGSSHGSTVGSTALFTCFLQGNLNSKLIDIAKKINLVLDFAELANLDGHDIVELFEKARNYRPDRLTVLNNYNNEQLVTKYREFKLFLKEQNL